jgi:hypothetical protein
MTSNKILPVALVAALLGGTVGAFVMRPSTTTTTPDTAQTTAQPLRANALAAGATAAANDQSDLDSQIAAETQNMSEDQKVAFREGFLEGVQAARDLQANGTRTVTRTAYVPTDRVAYRTRYAGSAPRHVYYDYGNRSGRSFWQKHRDKLSVAMGTGGGALLGALIGGKRGAGIGALAGAGGSALYTYKIRKRHRNY